MSFLDLIKKILGNGKKNAKFYTKTLKKNIGDPTPLEIGLYDGETPIINEEIGIEINTQKYIKTTDENGIATLNINLGVGKYTAKIYWRGNSEYNNITTYAEVIITTDTYIDGINLTKNQGESTPYQCALYRSDNGERIKDKINITINGVTYIREGDNDGLYKLNINLSEGSYNIKAEFTGTELFNPSSIENTIIINKAPAPEPQAPEETPKTPTGQESRHVKILNYFEDHFGECKYIDDALEAIQGRGYAFYFSDGYNMYETIDRVDDGDGANCFDIAEVLYHCAKGMNEKYGRNYEVQYLDVWCPVSGYDHIRLRLRVNGSDWFYRDGACILDGGDITDNWCGTSDNILEVNPSWIYDGD